MEVRNYLDILNHCENFRFKTFGFGFKPDFYNKFEWVQDTRLESYINRHEREVRLVRLGGDVGLHRDKDVKCKVKMIVLGDFSFEILGVISELKAGELIEFDGRSPHRGWNCKCMVMWNKR